MQNELNEVDKTFEYLAKSVESIAKFPNDEIAIKTKNNIWFFRGKGNAKGLRYDIVDVVDMNQLRVKVERNINGKIETQETTLSKLVQSPGNVNEVIAVTNKVKNEELRNLLDTEINNRVKAYTTKKGNVKEELFGLSYEHINGVANTIDESDLDDELKAEWKKINAENVEYVDISEDLKSIQDVGKTLGVINGTIQTFNSLVNVTAQQRCYP